MKDCCESLHEKSIKIPVICEYFCQFLLLLDSEVFWIVCYFVLWDRGLLFFLEFQSHESSVPLQFQFFVLSSCNYSSSKIPSYECFILSTSCSIYNLLSARSLSDLFSPVYFLPSVVFLNFQIVQSAVSLLF